MALGFSLYTYNSSTGTVIPDTSAIKTHITSEFTDIFGSNIDTSESSKIGRLIEALTMMFVEMLGVNAQNANQMNPNIASGQYLDSIASLFKISRTPATKTVVVVKFAGVSGTIIPASTAVSNDYGDVFLTTTEVEVLPNGYVTTQVESQNTGRYSANIVTINSAITGLNSVSTESIVQWGSSIESDNSLRARINTSRATGTSNIAAIVNAIYNSDDSVQSVLVLENSLGAAISSKGVLIFPHAIYVCVYGGDDMNIAKAIFDTKTVGASYVQNLAQGTLVTETLEYPADSGIEYTVYFYRPTEITDMTIRLTVRKLYASAIGETDIKEALKDYVTSQGIGGTISSLEAAVYINSRINGISVQDVTFDGVSSHTFNGYEIGVPESNIYVTFV